jgi:Phage integrase family
VHELGHVMGLPDLYPHQPGEPRGTCRTAGLGENLVGYWDLMSDVDHGEHFLGWHRHKNGWLHPARSTYIDQATRRRVTLHPLSGPDGLSMVVVPCDDIRRPRKVLVIEPAEPLYDLPQAQGVLVYSVDSGIDGGHSPVVHALTAACAGPYREVVPVLALAGLRWGELAGLQVGDRVSVPGPGLRLTRAVLASEGGGALYIDTLKNHRARTVPLVAELGPIIDRWSAGRSRRPGCSPHRAAGHCGSRTGSGQSAGGTARVAIGVPDVRVHDLRHTAASLWLAAGAGPKVVQRVPGHATEALTMDLYGHLVDASLWQAARLIGGITGAPELPEEPIRTENESARDAKNPQ